MSSRAVRRGIAVVAAVVALAAGGPPGVANAAPRPEPVATVRSGDGWRVDRVGRSLWLVTLRTWARDLRDAPPRLVVDGRDAGLARQSADRTTYTLLTTDARVARATRVALSYDEHPTGPTRAPAPPAPQPRRGPLLGVDPGADGRYAVRTAEYDFGDEAVDLPALGKRGELRAQVHWPDGLPGGPRPLVVFLHGRHNACFGEPVEVPAVPWPCAPGERPVPSYRGYAYAARTLASHGYVVVSISANAVNALDLNEPDGGALARAQLVLAHLDLWRGWATTGGAPFGTAFAGRVDLTNVGLMGHSRGGEGVVRAALLNLERPTPYGITAVLPLAPTDFTRPTLPGVALSVVLPYCDGDVSDLQGAHYVDDSRYAAADDAARSLVLVMGANHNYFNTEWTPGVSEAPSGDDWWWSNDQDPTCGRLGGQRLSDAEQRAIGRAYLAGFFRAYVGREAALLPLFDGSNARAASAGRAVVSVTAQQPGSRRLDVAAFEQSVPGVTSGAMSAVVCAGVLPGWPPEEPLPNPDLPPCTTDLLDFQAPHWTTSWLTATAPTGRVAHLRWNGAGALSVPMPRTDVRGYEALTFRAAPDPRAGAVDLVVRLVDGAGRTASVRVSSVSDALFHLPGDGMPLPRTVLRQVRVPLAGVRGVDLSDLRSVVLAAGGANGAAYVADLAFATPGLGTPTLAALPRLSIGDVSLVEGDAETVATFPVTLSEPLAEPATVHVDTISVGFQSRTVFVPVQRDVEIPAGVTSFGIEVPVLGNTLDDDDEMRFALVLSMARGVVPTDNTGVATVLDDDPTPTLSIGPGEAVESAGVLRFPLTLSEPSARYVDVAGELVDGTAVAGADYGPDPFAGTVVFVGDTTAWLDVPLVDDAVAEGAETFGFRLTLLNGAVLDPAVPPVVTATITDDD